MNQDYSDNKKPQEKTLPARKRCLKCRDMFDSTHRTREWVCTDCKGSPEWKDSSPMAPEGYGNVAGINEQMGSF